jgi:hypothetical protein
MAWTTPATFTSGQVVSAADLNAQVRDNMAYLLSRPAQMIQRTQASSYTTTSTTFTNVDGTNLIINLTTSGSRVLLGFNGIFLSGVNNQRTFYDVTIDGVRFNSVSNLGIVNTRPQTAGEYEHVAFQVISAPLTPGSHTYRLQWRCDFNSTAATLYATTATAPVIFYAVEVA